MEAFHREEFHTGLAGTHYEATAMSKPAATLAVSAVTALERDLKGVIAKHWQDDRIGIEETFLTLLSLTASLKLDFELTLAGLPDLDRDLTYIACHMERVLTGMGTLQ